MANARAQFDSVRRSTVARTESSRLREAQDREYQESVEADRQARERRDEEERQRIRQEEDERQQREEEEAIALSVQLSRETTLTRMRENLPEEPTSDGPGMIFLSINFI